MKTIGIVSEGPRDFELISAVVNLITKDKHSYRPLQPEPNMAGDNGNGWKGVWNWCESHAADLDEIMSGITPQMDLLIVQIDADVARKEREVHCGCVPASCDMVGKVHPLRCSILKEGRCPLKVPCAAHDKSPEGYIGFLRGFVHRLLKRQDKTLYVSVPCDSTDAWIVAAYDDRSDVEAILDPWDSVIAHGKQYHGIRIPGKKKGKRPYGELIKGVCENWDQVTQRCKEASDFQEAILSVLRR